ncbi:Alpha/Beta hydrolase protein [Pavlovales sp. CCMP2436]|nr:Alpha/Beta hydrolase protein [Pavlovales sp. CCMP2436]|mmetsp:Transcript_7821/g.20530  ORF Transcript_7821/g.20530 Transcript_7821/m.20530 type:complete len:181 (+) Transcript_7821:128-670(+)
MSASAFASAVRPTSKGPLSVRHGPEGGGTFLALCGLAGSGDWECAGIAAHLASGAPSYRVMLPEPASNPNTRASLGEFAVVLTATTLFGRGPCRESWMLDLLPSKNKSEGAPVVLAGHSWGGGAAARLAAAHPEAVSRLVLISPDVEASVARRCFPVPTLLIWAKDDYVRTPAAPHSIRI